MINTSNNIYYDSLVDSTGIQLDLLDYTLAGGGKLIYDGGTTIPPNPNTVPEPATLILFGSGLLGAYIQRKRKI